MPSFDLCKHDMIVVHLHVRRHNAHAHKIQIKSQEEEEVEGGDTSVSRSLSEAGRRVGGPWG